MGKRYSNGIIIAVLLLFIAGAGIFLWLDSRPSSQPTPQKSSDDKQSEKTPEVTPAQQNIAENLSVPWALDFLPDGTLIFTERSGNVKLIREGDSSPEKLAGIDEVAAEGEGGLLGLAVHPDFSENRYVYAYYTYRERGRLWNKVVRYKLNGSELVEDRVIIDRIPGAANHNGGRIKFGPDGLLYITTGDSLQADLAQDKDSLAGKILRLGDDGSVPADNPFPDSPVYSLGHRNPQGLAWDDRGRLWETEHGNRGNDEVNLIDAGQNYGWPLIEGDRSRAGLTRPIVHSNGGTWAPSGATVLDGRLFFGGLRGQALFGLNTGNPAAPQPHFSNEFGRIREAVVGPDGLLYIATNNRDGRGRPSAVDDRIIKIDPGRL